MAVQKCLSKCSSEQRERLADQVIIDCLALSQNEYGNYIIQNVIANGSPIRNQQILEVFAPHLVILCTQKFSSNVIEKCIENFDDETLNIMYGHLERYNVMK
jgi:hypothetical protein